MADDSPFAERPLDFGDDPRHRYRNPQLRDGQPGVDMPQMPQIRSRAGEWPNWEQTPFSHFPITPRIREEVAKGLPLFSLSALLGGVAVKPQEPEVSEDAPFGPSPF